MKTPSVISKYIYPTGLAVLALLVFTYIFDRKIDLNGDNCYYYAFASAIAAGEGYVDVAGEPSALFPPGYPLLMAPLRLITDSVVAQKVMNLLFLFAGTLLLYFTLIDAGVKRSLSFIACSAVLLTPHLLEFSTMMMSEASCILFIALSLWAYRRTDELLSRQPAAVWRSPWLWLFLVSVPFAFFIRTQAVVLFIAFFVTLLVCRRFKTAALLAGVFAISWLPWALRNSLLGLGQSRYVSQIDFSNVAGNVKMLLVQAIPESIVPFVPLRYNEVPSLLIYVIAALMLLAIVYGFLKIRGLRLPLLLLFAGNIAIVSIMNTPSTYRYMVIIMPFATAGLVVGLWSVLNVATTRWVKRSLTPWVMLLLFAPMLFTFGDKSKRTLTGLHKKAHTAYPIRFKNYLAIGAAIRKYPDAKLVASRKPELLYVTTGVRGKRLKELYTNVDILRNMLDENIDYVVLDNLGFSYTYNVLYPFLQGHPQLFTMVRYTAEPMNILFKFNRAEAREFLKAARK